MTKEIDFIAHRPVYAAIYDPLKPDPMMKDQSEIRMKFGMAFNVEGDNDHLPVSSEAYHNHRTGVLRPPRFSVRSAFSPTLNVTGWKELKDILDHLTVCNIPRDRVFRFVRKMTVHGAYLDKPEFEGSILVLKRVSFDAMDIDTAGLFE